VGWTATTNFADVLDLWDVQVDSAFTKARIGDQLLPVTKRIEIIHVKNEPDVKIEIHTLPGYGVFLPEEVLPVPRAFIEDGQLLVNWTGFRPTRELAGYLAMDRARDLDAYEAAVRLLDVGALNFLAADASGIDYPVHAAVPDRGPPAAHA